MSQYSQLTTYFLRLSQLEKNQEKYRRDLARTGVTPHMCLKAIVRSDAKNHLVTNQFLADFMRLDPSQTLPFVRMIKQSKRGLKSILMKNDPIKPEEGFLAKLYPEKNVDFQIEMQ